MERIEPMRFRIIKPFAALVILVAGFAGGIYFVNSIGTTPGPSSEASMAADPPPALTAQGKELLDQFSAAFEGAAAKVNPSVVPIFSEEVRNVQNPFGSAEDPFRQFFGDNFFRRFFGSPGGEMKQTIHALGSGVIVSRDGYILTNNHVVKGADKLTVDLGNNKKYTAKVVGTDPQTDVAVIKIDATDLPTATLGNSSTVRVGQWVIAVGNPFQLMHTVTAGIISAKGRSSVNLADYEDFIQTDASINPGNSGGALADLDGNVIGINTAIISPSGAGGNVGIGFAIPINMAKNVMEKLIATGKVTRGYLGLLPQDIDDNLAKALDLKADEGTLVGDVTSGGPADKAGIKRGDVITEFNGKKIKSSSELRNEVAEASPGSTATVNVLRNGKEMKFQVKLGDRPEQVASTENSGQEEAQVSKKLGLTVQTLTRDLAKQLGFDDDHGAVVTNVEPGSLAEDAGIRSKDLIKEVGRTPVATAAEFERAVGKMKKGDEVAFLVRRGENNFYVAMEVP